VDSLDVEDVLKDESTSNIQTSLVELSSQVQPLNMDTALVEKTPVNNVHYESFFTALKRARNPPSSTAEPAPVLPSTAAPLPELPPLEPEPKEEPAVPEPPRKSAPLPEPLQAEEPEPENPNWRTAHQYVQLDHSNPNDHRNLHTPGPLEVYVVNQQIPDLRDDRPEPAAPPKPPNWQTTTNHIPIPLSHSVPVPPPSTIPHTHGTSLLSSYDASIDDPNIPPTPLAPVPLRDVLPLQADLVDKLPARLTRQEEKDLHEEQWKLLQELYA